MDTLTQLKEISDAMAAALRRVLPYANNLPPTAIAEVRGALASYIAWTEIVQVAVPPSNSEEGK